MTPCAKCREAVDRHLGQTYQQNKMLQAALDYKNAAITHALAAMDNGEQGTARRILRTGSEKPPMTQTGVIAKDGA